jgi:hypothetical protein
VLAKQWIRLRLSSGLNVGTVTGYMQALTRFSEYLTAVGPTVVRGLGDVDRALLDYLAWLTFPADSARTRAAPTASTCSSRPSASTAATTPFRRALRSSPATARGWPAISPSAS